MVIVFPQVGHCPSWAAIDSVASSRDEQYPQLNPYRFPPDPAARKPIAEPGTLARGVENAAAFAPPPAPAPSAPAPPAPAPTAPAPTPTIAGAVLRVGTFSVVRHCGQRTIAPACD